MVAPVVLASMAAAVQGVANVKLPNHGSVIPTSLFFAVIANSGSGKSTVLRQVTEVFNEYEQGKLTEKCHPFVFQDTTKAGVTTVLNSGAKSMYYALDEGAEFFCRLDMAEMCKRFDGSAIRIARKDKYVLLHGVSTSLCLMTQEATFERFLKSKSDLAIESGLLPRILLSQVPDGRLNVKGPIQDLSQHWFHQRLRELMKGYADGLDHQVPRTVLVMDDAALRLFDSAKRDWQSAAQNGSIQFAPFLHRASEHALRLAAVLQWFYQPQEKIVGAAMQAAIAIVNWHLDEAWQKYGTSNEIEHSAEKLLGYLMCRLQTGGQPHVSRKEILQQGPKGTRTAAQLDAALQALRLRGSISETKIDKVTMIGPAVPRMTWGR